MKLQTQSLRLIGLRIGREDGQRSSGPTKRHHLVRVKMTTAISCVQGRSVLLGGPLPDEKLDVEVKMTSHLPSLTKGKSERYLIKVACGLL
jgi:hypothetical protein